MTDNSIPDMTLFSRIADGVVITGVVGERAFIVYANAAFLEMTGYARDELMGQSYSVLEGAETDRVTTEFLEESLRRGREFRAIVTYCRKDGTPFSHEMTVLPLRVSSGQVSCFLGIHRAVARLDDAHVDAHDRHDGHDDDTGSLPSNSDLFVPGVDRATSESCADLLHDVRGSLGAMLSFASVLGATLSEPQQLEWLRAIERNGRNCEHLLSQRAGAGVVVTASPELTDRLVRARSPADLSGRRILVVDDDEGVCESVRVSLEGADADVVIVGDGVRAVDLVLEAVADRCPFDLVMMDMQLPGKSGYEATAELRRGGYCGVIMAFTAATLPGDGARCLDAGCDMYVAKSFAGSRVAAIVSECCEVSGGRDDGLQRRARLDGVDRNRNGKRVLVVDDNPDTVRALACLLERGGHVARTATDGRSAVDVCKTFSPEVALIDLRLPDMDGHALLARLRELHAGLTAFAVSGLDSPRARTLALDRGFDDLFVKPVDFAQLERAILPKFSEESVAERSAAREPPVDGS